MLLAQDRSLVLGWDLELHPLGELGDYPALRALFAYNDLARKIEGSRNPGRASRRPLILEASLLKR